MPPGNLNIWLTMATISRGPGKKCIQFWAEIESRECRLVDTKSHEIKAANLLSKPYLYCKIFDPMGIQLHKIQSFGFRNNNPKSVQFTEQ